jgi:hypothetical protein
MTPTCSSSTVTRSLTSAPSCGRPRCSRAGAAREQPPDVQTGELGRRSKRQNENAIVFRCGSGHSSRRYPQVRTEQIGGICPAAAGQAIRL